MVTINVSLDLGVGVDLEIEKRGAGEVDPERGLADPEVEVEIGKRRRVPNVIRVHQGTVNTQGLDLPERKF